MRFPAPELHERRYDLDQAHPGIVRSMAAEIGALTMARYRPSAYRTDMPTEAAAEAALAGLMQSQVLKRFESSWYSALQTVKKMRHANLLLLHTLREQGGVPAAEVVRAAVGDMDDDFSLDGLVEDALAESEGWVPAERFRDDFATDLRKDADRLGEMTTLLESLKGQTDPKIEALRALMAETQSQKVAIFTTFQDTAVYLKGLIEDDPTLLGGRPWTVVIGSETDANARTRELERFCPESVNGQPGFTPPDGEVDVLLSTDVLSEGQNLQQAQAVLSFDMPWNPQRVVQRNGRVIRLRSPHDTAYLYTLLPTQGDLNQLLQLEAALQAKILAANVSVGMETPVLAGVDPESQIYADLDDYVSRLADGDSSLLDDQDVSGSAFAGEIFRAHLHRAAAEGDVNHLLALPWGIGAAFTTPSAALPEAAVFFACRTRRDERYWRVVSGSGDILHREVLPMLRLIDPQDRPGCPVPGDMDLEHLFAQAAADICAEHNALLDPEARAAALPASQRWAQGILRSPDAAPVDDEERYSAADQALTAGRNNLVRRDLSDLRRQYADGVMNLVDCAQRIVEVVEHYGLRPVDPPELTQPITEDDLGVVCYQIVLPAG